MSLLGAEIVCHDFHFHCAGGRCSLVNLSLWTVVANGRGGGSSVVRAPDS